MSRTFSCIPILSTKKPPLYFQACFPSLSPPVSLKLAGPCLPTPSTTCIPQANTVRIAAQRSRCHTLTHVLCTLPTCHAILLHPHPHATPSPLAPPEALQCTVHLPPTVQGVRGELRAPEG